jgi:hypothetical protein
MSTTWSHSLAVLGLVGIDRLGRRLDGDERFIVLSRKSA